MSHIIPQKVILGVVFAAVIFGTTDLSLAQKIVAQDKGQILAFLNLSPELQERVVKVLLPDIGSKELLDKFKNGEQTLSDPDFAELIKGSKFVKAGRGDVAASLVIYENS